MGFIVTPLGTFLEGTEHAASQEIQDAARVEVEVAEKTAEAEIESFRNEIVAKVADLEKTVEGK